MNRTSPIDTGRIAADRLRFFCLLLAATAIPADFELRLESNWTIAHAVFVLLGPVAFIWAACVWPRALAGLGVSEHRPRMCGG